MCRRREGRDRNTGNFEPLFANSSRFQNQEGHYRELGFFKAFSRFFRKGWTGRVTPWVPRTPSSQKALKREERTRTSGCWLHTERRPSARRAVAWRGRPRPGRGGGRGQEGRMGPQDRVRRGLCRGGGPGDSSRRHRARW